MRTLNIIMGGLFVIAGVGMIAGYSGITFLSVAFVVGLLMMAGGVAGCLSYNSYREGSLDKTWVWVDGLTTFTLGFLIIANRLAADTTVPLVLGLWVTITGIRNLVRAWEKIDVKDSYFYGHLSVGLLHVIAGLYMYYNNDLLALPVGALVGICILIHGLNIFMIAFTILITKSEFIMTKEEMLEKAAENVEKAHLNAKEAIKAFKEAKTTVAVIEETEEAKLDPAAAPKPGSEPTEEKTTEETEETK